MCFKTESLDFLQKQDSIRDELLDILEVFKEQHAALLEVLLNSLVLPTVDLQRTLQAFYELKSQVNTMVNNMDVIEEHLPQKNSRKHSQMNVVVAYLSR